MTCETDCSKVPKPKEPNCGKNQKVYYEECLDCDSGPGYCHKLPKCVDKNYCDPWEANDCGKNKVCGSSGCECIDDMVEIDGECMSMECPPAPVCDDAFKLKVKKSKKGKK